jgi:hypothetical protein
MKNCWRKAKRYRNVVDVVRGGAEGDRKLHNRVLRCFIFKPNSARVLSLIEDRSSGSSPVCLIEDCKVSLCT